MCTGALWPTLVMHDQQPETFASIDISHLSSRDEAALRRFVADVVLDGYVCGSIFDVGGAAARAQELLRDEGVDLSLPDEVPTIDLFVHHVSEWPELRRTTLPCWLKL